MGQMTYGILYGEEVPEGCESQLYDLIEEWRKENYKTCEHRGSEDAIPAWESENPCCYVGFFVAVGASGIESLPSLEACSLLGVQQKYTAAVESAKQRWIRFADWAISQGANISGLGQLWLIETEVA